MSEEAPWDQDSEGGDSTAGNVIRHLAVSLAVSIFLATVFTAWAPASLNPGEFIVELLANADQQPTPLPAEVATQPFENRQLRVGIVAGHSGLNPDTGYIDSGATCPDGLTELQVNTRVAQLVMRNLEDAGFEVDLLQEFDPHLNGYRAAALVSIHADSCYPINDRATGYKVASALDTQVPDRSQRLATCIADRYGKATDLAFHPHSITPDMTEYHTFHEINSLTPAVIIETGFLYLDREILTRDPEKIARGISQGILCYVNNEPAALPQDEGS